MGAIKLDKVEKWFGDLQVIKGIDLEIQNGEFVVFVGPSGCGKSTLLRMIAGLEETSRGRILLDDVDVTAEPPSGRELSMVFQSYALYPHMSVGDNMAFGLKVSKADKQEIKDKVAKASDILKLDDYLDRLPKALSGGQRQRVAIGRAIVREPKGFLFDEPLSNLDASLRVQMRFEIAKLHDQLGATMIYVTHDQVEAMTLADKIVVLKDGEIMQVGTPQSLYEDPDNLFVAQFIGSPKMNVLPCSVQGKNAQVEGFTPVAMQLNNDKSSATHMGVRPEHIGICGPDQGNCTGLVEFTEYLGSDTFVYVSCGTLETITIRCRETKIPQKGEKVGLKFDEGQVFFFDQNAHTIK